ncbi:hypothetical protein NQZ68_040348 [Dissostichus eleginoides]|nr:hypothetical protein NQZ68_040348 [Dissostichus eleginoides]
MHPDISERLWEAQSSSSRGRSVTQLSVVVQGGEVSLEDSSGEEKYGGGCRRRDPALIIARSSLRPAAVAEGREDVCRLGRLPPSGTGDVTELDASHGALQEEP